MLQELQEQRSDRASSIHAFTEESNSNEEHPVEQHVRRYDTSPMPESYASYLRQHDQRMRADAHNEGWAGSCRVRDITIARDAMRSILQHRSQRARLDNPELSPAAILREQGAETMATDGITFQITVHKSERDACRKRAKHAEMRCELLTWALKGHHAPAKLRTLQEKRDTLTEEHVSYRSLEREHHIAAEELEREKASYAATAPQLTRVFQDDDGGVHHLSSD
jgi:hypothetical protein